MGPMGFSCRSQKLEANYIISPQNFTTEEAISMCAPGSVPMTVEISRHDGRGCDPCSLLDLHCRWFKPEQEFYCPNHGLQTILFGICDMAEISPFKWPPHITIHQGPKPFLGGENYLNSKVSKPGILQDLHHRTRSFARTSDWSRVAFNSSSPAPASVFIS